MKANFLETITAEIIQNLIRNNEIALSPTQKRLCIPIINRIYKKMCAGIKFSGIKVEGTIIGDGHHRYLASLLAGYSLNTIPTYIPSSAIIGNWASVVFDEEGWDTPAKINMLNQQDASYNSMSLEEIVSLLQ